MTIFYSLWVFLMFFFTVFQAYILLQISKPRYAKIQTLTIIFKKNYLKHLQRIYFLCNCVKRVRFSISIKIFVNHFVFLPLHISELEKLKTHYRCFMSQRIQFKTKRCFHINDFAVSLPITRFQKYQLRKFIGNRFPLSTTENSKTPKQSMNLKFIKLSFCRV